MSPKKKHTVAKKAPKKETKVKIRVNPAKEFAEAMKAQGIATVSHLSNDEAVSNIPGRVGTGSLALDMLLTNPSEPTGWAGFPLGRVTEVYGPPHIGKSTLLDHGFAEVQKMDGQAVLADTEISRDRHYTNRLGVDLEKLSYLEFARDGLFLQNVVKVICKTIDFWGKNYPETPVLIGWDALGGTATKEDVDKALKQEVKQDEKEKAVQPGSAAKAMHQASRLFPGLLAGRKIGVVILNHEYEMIGGFGGGFGAKRKETYGGSGTRHLCTNRIQLFSKGEYIKKSDGSVVGRVVTAKIVKNRLGASLTEVGIPILHGSGVSNIYTVFEDLKEAKIIVTSGGWSAINLDGVILKFQGWNGLNEKCNEDPTLFDRLVSVWKAVKHASLRLQVPEVQQDGGSDNPIRETEEPAEA